MKRPKILCAVGESLRKHLASLSREAGDPFEMEPAGPELALNWHTRGYEAVLLEDDWRSDWAGIVTRILNEDPAASIILLTRRGSEQLVIDALRLGVRCNVV